LLRQSEDLIDRIVKKFYQPTVINLRARNGKNRFNRGPNFSDCFKVAFHGLPLPFPTVIFLVGENMPDIDALCAVMTRCNKTGLVSIQLKPSNRPL
jgi:hypothetical protein